MKIPNQTLIEISIENGCFKTKFRPYKDIDTITIAVALASATRVIAESFRQNIGLDENHTQLILEQIVQIYNNDIKMGTLGEEETTHLTNLK